MRYPVELPVNGTIGFVAPSFGAATEPYKSAFDNGLFNLSIRGFRPSLGPNCYAGEGIGISNTPVLCAEELTESYCSPDNDAIISVGGGELMCEILDHVDFDAIASADPKWYMGFSDNTNFTFLLNTLCDTASIYGPTASYFGMEPWHPCVEDALALMTGNKSTVSNYDSWELHEDPNNVSPYAPFNTTERFDPVVYDEHSAVTGKVHMEGRLIGGCLDCLCNISGTKYDKVREFCEKYKEDGIIWFLESCDLNTMSFRRAMWQLKHTGWFEHTKGFIFGRPYLYEDCTLGLNWEDAMLEHIRDLNVPVIRNADLGHLPPMMPIISGAMASVDATTDTVDITFIKK